MCRVAALNGAKILLVAFAVAGILVNKEGSAGLDLGLEDGEPELLGADCFVALAFGLGRRNVRLHRALVGACDDIVTGVAVHPVVHPLDGDLETGEFCVSYPHSYDTWLPTEPRDRFCSP